MPSRLSVNILPGTTALKKNVKMETPEPASRVSYLSSYSEQVSYFPQHCYHAKFFSASVTHQYFECLRFTVETLKIAEHSSDAQYVEPISTEKPQKDEQF